MSLNVEQILSQRPPGLQDRAVQAAVKRQEDKDREKQAVIDELTDELWVFCRDELGVPLHEWQDCEIRTGNMNPTNPYIELTVEGVHIRGHFEFKKIMETSTDQFKDSAPVFDRVFIVTVRPKNRSSFVRISCLADLGDAIK